MKTRNFPILAVGATLGATALLFSADNLAPSETADTIYHGGSIITIDDANPRAEAVAVKNGKIIAVGKKDDVLKTKSDSTKLVDLTGKTMLPGFVDPHGHVFAGGIQALSANLLAPPDGEVKDIASLQQTLRDWMEANKEAVEKVQLVIGFGYDNSQLAELRHPTREDLDAVSKDIPVLLIHQSAHLAAANSKALEIGGITADTPNPQGGVIQRREGSQEPNGVLEETAAFPLIMKLLGRVGPEGASAFIKAGSELWARFGYTTAQEGRSSPGVVKAMQAYASTGDLKIDVATYPDVLIDREMIKASAAREYTNRFRVAGAKLTIDGTPQGFTAWRDRPYYKPVGNYPPGYAGYPAATADQVRDAIDWAYQNDIQIITHANGEAASDQLIAFIGAAARKHGAADRRSTLIHGQFLREDQVDSYKRLGVIPSLFPMHTFYWGDWHRDHTVGPVLAENISPTGWCIERGMMFTTHHDAPVAFPGLDARARCHRDPPLAQRRHPWSAPTRRCHDGPQGDDDLACLSVFRGEEQRFHRNRQTRRLRHPRQGSHLRGSRNAGHPQSHPDHQGRKHRLSRRKKDAAHLSRPDQRGEHPFSNFIRQMVADSEEHAGHNHTTSGGHSCGCEFAVFLGDVITRSSAAR
jgi:predicted amidohydrolase YtcJ